MHDLSISDVIGLLLCAGAIIGWFMRLESRLGTKVDREELRIATEKLEIVTRQYRLDTKEWQDKQEEKFDNLLEKIEEHAEKASQFRHDSRDSLNQLTIQMAVLIRDLNKL